MPNCTAADLSTLKQTIHIRVRFNISSSCCSVVGFFGRRCRFKSVAILTLWDHVRIDNFVMQYERDVPTEWQDLCTASYDLLPSDVRAQNRCSGEYMLDTIRRTCSHRSVHWPRHSSQSAWRSGTLRVYPSTAMKSHKLYQGY